jgi:hypothetical protein
MTQDSQIQEARATKKITLFAAMQFLGGALLFMLIAQFCRITLPLLSGATQVWLLSTSYAFLCLMAGCVFAIFMPRHSELKKQLLIQSLLLVVPFISLPLRLPVNWQPPGGFDPLTWVISALSLTVLLPGFAISSMSMISLQWFGRMTPYTKSDVFRLYSSFFAGGGASCLLYGLFLERFLPLTQRGLLLAGAYALYVLVALGTIYVVFKQASANEMVTAEPQDTENLFAFTPDHFRWIAYSFIPASITLSVCTYIGSALSPSPVFLCLPLAIYAISQAISFTPEAASARIFFRNALPLAVMLLIGLLTSTAAIRNAGEPHPIPLYLLAVHLIALLVVAGGCLGHLADEAPQSKQLNEFLVCVALGSALGFLFNACVAPRVFTSFVEYPLMLGVAAVLLTPRISLGFQERVTIGSVPSLLVPVCVGVLALLAFTYDGFVGVVMGALHNDLLEAVVDMLWRYLAPLAFLVYYAPDDKQFRLGLTALLLVAGINFANSDQSQVLASRNFFGCHRVRIDANNNWCELWRGHGRLGKQSLDPDIRKDPLGAFYPHGPMGSLLLGKFWTAAGGAQPPFALIGMGCASPAAYVRSGQTLSIFEPDPEIDRLAQNPFYFTHLFSAIKRDARLETIAGDGRTSLKLAPDHVYSLLLVDLPNIGPLPTHLLTKEALSLFLQKTSLDGMIAFHVTNPYYGLQPVLWKLAMDLNLYAVVSDDVDESELKLGRDQSSWILLSADQNILAPYLKSGWTALSPHPEQKIWTDECSDPLSVLVR